jgi:enoyl-CoA hydratase/carnithine racemase
MVDVVGGRSLLGALALPVGVENLLDCDPPLLVVDLADLERADPEELRQGVERLRALPVVVLGINSDVTPNAPAVALVDVVAQSGDDAYDRIEAAVTRHPRAATALVTLLRGTAERSIADGLLAESAVYSMLQAGPEFAIWRGARAVRNRPQNDRPTVRVERTENHLHITLARPEVRNALNTQTRDELYEALLVAASDPSLRVLLDGEGPTFCAGGDLDEFGSRSDPSNAHVIRLRRSVGRMIASIADRVEVVVHGTCMGSGVELPAFAGKVIAQPDTRFGLPELELGLIPGAGGTVSVPARIGRHRAAYLALSGAKIDAQTARAWGLVDVIRDSPGGT